MVGPCVNNLRAKMAIDMHVYTRHLNGATFGSMHGDNVVTFLVPPSLCAHVCASALKQYDAEVPFHHNH